MFRALPRFFLCGLRHAHILERTRHQPRPTGTAFVGGVGGCKRRLSLRSTRFGCVLRQRGFRTVVNFVQGTWLRPSAPDAPARAAPCSLIVPSFMRPSSRGWAMSTPARATALVPDAIAKTRTMYGWGGCVLPRKTRAAHTGHLGSTGSCNRGCNTSLLPTEWTRDGVSPWWGSTQLVCSC